MVSPWTSITASPCNRSVNNFDDNINQAKVMGSTHPKVKSNDEGHSQSCPRIFLSAFVVWIVGESLLNLLQY